MKKLFLIFTVLFTCALPVSGFGDFITSSKQEFASFKNEQQNDFMNLESKIQQKSLDFQKKNHQKFDNFQTRSQQEINNLRNESDNKIAEIKRKSAEAFEKLEKEYNDFIQGTPFVNCIPGWSFLECKQVNNLSKSTWSCKLKSGITAQKMSSDVEAYCTQKSDAFEYDPLDNFEEPENEENDTPIRMNAQVEELSSEDDVNSHAEHNENTDFDFMAAQKQEQEKKDWNTNYEDSDKTPDSAPAPTQDKSASAMIAQEATRKAEKNKKNCNLAQRNKINATDCKISADGAYSDIVCKAGYTKNTDGTKCEKSDAPDKKAKPKLIKISGIVIDATSENNQPIAGVRIKYDEGKKDKDGEIKYALHQTGNNGRFTINIVPNSTITFTHKMYQDTTTSYSVATKDVKIKMNPTDPEETSEQSEDKKIQELRDKADAAHERENSMANKMLGAAGIGATGVGGMMLMQGLSEQKADGNAQEQMRAYLSTFMCRYGDGRAKGGESDIELPGANALLPLYAEYVTLANETKAMKTELDLKPGIESESILDNAASGLYDDENSGKTSGAFASLARALQNPDGEDAKKWAEQTEKTSKNIKTGAITAGAGAVGGLVGHITESAVYKKKAEKGKEDSDDNSDK